MSAFFSHRLPSYKPQNASSNFLADMADRVSPRTFDNIQSNADFFGWLVEGSPFLAQLMRRYPDVLDALGQQSPQAYCDGLLAALGSALPDTARREDWMSLLRTTRNRIALTIGLADLADDWCVEDVVQAMTALGDCVVAASLDWLLADAVRNGKLKHPAPHGLVVLALGKHGGQELNYSSDIDIVVYYTPDAMALADGLDERKFFVDLVRDLHHLLQHRSEDGYVFRVDLRLRPDPGATQIALSVPAALAYYESLGQNWERAVYIKARPIAGDKQAGQDFLADLSPYIWRRYFDFASIEDVHSMKRQIHAVRGHAAIAAAGHNIKLGRGGIREIEFFVQTQQLIAGGRDEGLRGRRTVDMLASLAARNWISHDAARGLTQSYYFLRRLEHRLQMQHDEQTHILPNTAQDFAAFARFAGFANTQTFEAELMHHLTYVAREYSHLFEHAESLSAESGNLVFIGQEDDPDTIETLHKMGFARPQDISAVIRGWHAGRLRATRTPRSREILTRLLPQLLQALALATDPDDAFMRFHNFLEKLPAGVQFFSLVQSQPAMLDLLVSIITIAPHLSHRLSRNVQLIDVLIEKRPLVDNPFATLPPDADFQHVLDILRLHVHEAQFATGVQIMSDPQTARQQGRYFTRLAEQTITALLPAALKDIERQYGIIADGEIAIIGMGKLGSYELALQSDLDIIIICDCPDFAALSNGAQAISAEKWFARAARRILSGLTATTAEGGLYEVDTRLRPSGNAGALVAKLASFEAYQNEQAWTWEHLALTRARPIASTGTLGQRVDDFIHTLLCRPRNVQTLAGDIADMRARLTTSQPSQSILDVRRGAGGLMELEFICQSLQLAHSASYPDLICPQPIPDALRALQAADCLPPDTYDGLRDAAVCYAAVRQVATLCMETMAELPPQAGLGLILQATDTPDMSRLSETINHHRAHVSMVLDKILSRWAHN